MNGITIWERRVPLVECAGDAQLAEALGPAVRWLVTPGESAPDDAGCEIERVQRPQNQGGRHEYPEPNLCSKCERIKQHRVPGAAQAS